MDSYDVAVIGGGPAGYAAALKAAELGARVCLVEAENPGGACVNFACIPTNILLGSALAFLEAREFDVMGVFGAGEQFNFGRAVARKDALLPRIAGGVRAMLRMRKVELVNGRAAFRDAHSLDVSLVAGGAQALNANAIVIATGSRWEAPAIPGLPADTVMLPDQLQRLTVAPARVAILSDGPGTVPFGLEYAVLLAAAGSEVTVLSRDEELVAGLDPDLQHFARKGLESLGIRVVTGVLDTAGTRDSLTVTTAGELFDVAVDSVLAADPRHPFVHGLGLERAGLAATRGLGVDRSCRTAVPHIYAAGDVTGGAMLSNVSTHMGEVAGANAAGGNATTRIAAIPRLLHTFPTVGWVGLTEADARNAGYDVTTGAADIGFNAMAVAMGAREGAVKVVAERELGEVLGVHVAGPRAEEILAVATAAMQAEIPLDDLAAMVHWHPGIAESLVEASRRAR